MDAKLQVGKWASAPHPYLTDLGELFACPDPDPAKPVLPPDPPPGWPRHVPLPKWWPELAAGFPVEAAWEQACQGCGFPVLVLGRLPEPDPQWPFDRAWFCPACGRDPTYDAPPAETGQARPRKRQKQTGAQ